MVLSLKMWLLLYIGASLIILENLNEKITKVILNIPFPNKVGISLSKDTEEYPIPKLNMINVKIETSRQNKILFCLFLKIRLIMNVISPP